ncbi:MAG: SprT family zinc-dependent metalloprotease [Verrucomicrobiota bacterium]
MQLAFKFLNPIKRAPSRPEDKYLIDGEWLPVTYKKNARARNYLLYVRTERSLSVTIPRRGNKSEAAEFIESKNNWIRRQLRRLEAQLIPPKIWKDGTTILFRGQEVTLRTEHEPVGTVIYLGGEKIYPTNTAPNLRPIIESHLREIARKELIVRTHQMAKQHDLSVKRVTVRNQSSRWGSCSEQGSISLNWRLIQAPPDVRDYVILHELMHLFELNHSNRFWALVSGSCPNYKELESWLRLNAARLGL